jgi:hypothetical protein
VQTGFASELSSPAPEVSSPADSGALSRFTAVEDGKALVEQWGVEAPARVARVQARSDRLLKSMSHEQRGAALRWFDNLPSNQARAVLEQLSR